MSVMMELVWDHPAKVALPVTPPGIRSAVRTHAGEKSGLSWCVADGKRPVQRLKAWLKEADPS